MDCLIIFILLLIIVFLYSIYRAGYRRGYGAGTEDAAGRISRVARGKWLD